MPQCAQAPLSMSRLRPSCVAQVRRGATAERPACSLPDWA